MNVQTASGKKLALLQSFAGGGEAKIWTVRERADLVAKIYHQPSAEAERKLKAMLANRPVQPRTHVAIAWPYDLLYEQNRFVGFIMPNVQGNEPIVNFYNPLRRKQCYAGFTWRYLHRTALNLTIAAEAIHACGHVIGDVNESNLLANSQALITLVDTDSFQIHDKSGLVYRCQVGKAEYTARELQGADFHTVERRIEHDLFGLSVLLFHLLMEGFHPFTGILRNENSAVNRTDLYCIKHGIFPYYNQRAVKPPPAAPPFELLHPNLQRLFLSCFVDGHQDPAGNRPTMRMWRQVLEQVERKLVTCSANPEHVYSNHLVACPWCARQGMQQRPLPPASKTTAPPTMQPTMQPTVPTAVVAQSAGATVPRPGKRRKLRPAWLERFRREVNKFKRRTSLPKLHPAALLRWRPAPRDWLRNLKPPSSLRDLVIQLRLVRYNMQALAARPSVRRVSLVTFLVLTKLALQFVLPSNYDDPLSLALSGLTILPTIIAGLVGGMWVGLAVGALTGLLDFYPSTDLVSLAALVIPASLTGLTANTIYGVARRQGEVRGLLITGATGGLIFWLGMAVVYWLYYDHYPLFSQIHEPLVRSLAPALATLIVLPVWRRLVS